MVRGSTYLSAIQAHRSSVIPMMCPTINSYKRLLGGEVSLYNLSSEGQAYCLGVLGSGYRFIRL